jgi:hypothetical protein
MVLASLGFGKSSSNNVSSGATAGYDLQENISQSGSQQGSNAASSGINISQSGQNIYGGQQPYIDNIYANAANLYGNYGMPDRQVADINPMLAQGLGQQYGFSQGTGNDIFRQQLMQSLANTGGFGTASDAANRMASGGVYQAPTVANANYGGAAQLAGMTGMAGAQYANDPNLAFSNRLAGSAGFSGGAQSNVNLGLAGAIANNPYLDGQIDAASRDVMRNLGENQLTGNAAMAAGTGNSGSSRRAVMDAIAMRGAGDRVADISAGMRGAAYQQGVATAAEQAALNANLRQNNQQYNTGQFNQLLGQGASMEQQRALQNAQLGTQNSQFNTGQYNQMLGQGAGFAQQQAIQNAQLTGQNQALNAGLMGQGANLAFNIGQAGQQGMGQAYQTGVNNAQLAQDTGGQLRQYQQQLLDTQYSNQMNPYNSLQMYKSLIGDPTVLSSSNSIGLDNSTSNSFGNSFNNSYSYGMGGNMGSNSATGNSKSFNANIGFG